VSDHRRASRGQALLGELFRGDYSIELIFSSDLIFQLQDLDQQRVLTSEVLRVIREAIRFRHKRREPWDLFD
jgi:hypothetical protein